MTAAPAHASFSRLRSAGDPHPRGADRRFDFPGKDRRLSLLGERPLVAETPESLLDDDTTPTEKLYVRNNGQIPAQTSDPGNWTVTIDGEVERPLRLTLRELKAEFEPVTCPMVMECGGNGRSFFVPPPEGNPWTNGGVGCPQWTGVRLANVLDRAGLKSTAVFTGHYGTDPSGEPGVGPFSRGVPIAKALERHNLLVWAINGAPLPHIHGFPLRLVIPGWPASVSAKWLTRIWIRDRVHDGRGMGGTSYRVPIEPMVPGSEADESNFRDIESMPVRSIITRPANDARLPAGTRQLNLRGAAWAGDLTVAQVDVTIDSGATWQRAELGAPRNRYDWQRWTAAVTLPSDGYYEIAVRAADSNGVMQPFSARNWNPQGYCGNAMHRIAVVVG